MKPTNIQTPNHQSLRRPPGETNSHKKGASKKGFKYDLSQTDNGVMS